MILSVVAAVALLTGRAPSDTFTYSTSRRQVRVGIVASEALKVGANGINGSENPDPYIFYVMESRHDLKPLGYEFLNPLAPAVITAEIYKRWLDRVRTTDPAFVPAQPESQVFKVGANVTKNMGAYWEVNLDTVSADELRQYDLLYLHSHKPQIAFSADQREKLRRFVDSGGTLWVENAGGMSFGVLSPFMLDVNMVNAQTGSSVIATPNHALLTYPYLISQQELQGLGVDPVSTVGGYFAEYSQATGAPIPGVQVPAAHTMIPLVWNTRGAAPTGPITPNPAWRANILVGQLGAGRLVFSAQDVGGGINDFAGGSDPGYGGNSGAIAGQAMLAARPIDLKFAYNLASWSAAQSTAHSDVRRSGSTPERMGAVLDTKWATPANAAMGTLKVGGAAYFRNTVYAVDGNLILRCYDARPGQDLDGDGNADDGTPDYIAGASQDVIWSFPLVTGGALEGASTPTVFEFYDPDYTGRHGNTTLSGLANFNLRELVVVALSDGTILAVRALPRVAGPNLPLAANTELEWSINNNNIFSAAPQPYWWNLFRYPINNAPHSSVNDIDPNQDLPIPSVAWSEGALFAAVTTTNGGRILALDPREGRNSLLPGINGASNAPTSRPGMNAVPQLAGSPAFVSTPTVGYVRDNASGAIDKVIYVNAANTTTSVASMRAFWFATRAEPLTRGPETPPLALFNSRADRPWFSPDPAASGDANMIYRPRLFHVFRDPRGTYFSQEFRYAGVTGVAPPPAPGVNDFTVGFSGTFAQITINNTVNTPLGVLPTNDERNQFLADYTLDWRTLDDTGAEKAPNRRVNARSTFFAPDVAVSPPPGGSQIGGAPALTGDDLLAYTVTTGGNMIGGSPSNPGNGVVFAVNEQHLRPKLRWAFTMHDGFPMPVNGTTVVVPPRLRQLDPTLPGYHANFLTSVQFFGTPAYKDGVIYAVGRGEIGPPGGGGPAVSVLCAFRANPQIRIRLNQKIDPSTAVRIRQVNVVKSQGLPDAFSGGLGGTPLWVDLNLTQYSMNWDSGEITINSGAANLNLDNFVSTSIPFVVKIGNGPEQVIAGQTIDLNVNTNNREARMIGPAGADNLLWYAAIPANFGFTFNNTPVQPMGFVSSSPSIMGNTIWLGTQNGFVLSFDADPSARDPQFQGNGGQVYLLPYPGPGGVTRPGALRQAEQLFTPGASMASIVSPPAGTSNLMMVNSNRGTHTLEDAFTVIADSKRIIEVNAAGDAVWTSDSSKTYGVAGGELPRYVLDPITGTVNIANAAQATGLPVGLNVPYSRPTVARRVGLNDLLIVDTGNNRVVQIDRGGSVVWEVHRLFNDLGLLRPGDPLTLNEPTDVQHWTEFLNNFQVSAVADGTTYTYSGPAYVVHYLISDTGNFRVIELIDAYDPSGNPIRPQSGAGGPAPFSMLRQVWFASSSYGVYNKRYRYRSVQRILMRNTDLPPAWQDPALPMRQLTLSAISNARLSGVGAIGQNVAGDIAESGGGSLVVLNEQGNPLSIVSNLRIPDTTAGNPSNYRIQPIVNPTWFSKFDEIETRPGHPNFGALTFRYLLADDNGVYQLEANTADPRFMDVQWLLTADDYYWMTGKRLRAASVRRLSSAANNVPNVITPPLHNFLIANRFSGEDNPTVFGITYNASGNAALGNIASSSAVQGEVFVVNPRTFDIGLSGSTRAARNNMHGYQPSYFLGGAPLPPNTLVRNSNASVTFSSPNEILPPVGFVGFLRRAIGDPTRATSSSLLVQPSYADRPF